MVNAATNLNKINEAAKIRSPTRVENQVCWIPLAHYTAMVGVPPRLAEHVALGAVIGMARQCPAKPRGRYCGILRAFRDVGLYNRVTFGNRPG
jgi:hypothetical protein